MPVTTTYMGLTIPDAGPTGTAGPTYATMVNTDLSLLDAHDHSPGKGTTVPTAGINVNADLPLNGFNAKTIRALRFNSQSANITPGGAEIGEVYVYSGDLWYINSSGVAIQLTIGSAINTSTSGAITGMGGTGAAVTYNNAAKTFSFTQAGNQAATIDGGSLTIREQVVSGNGVTLKAAASQTAYNLTFPAAAPAASELVWTTAAGQIGFGGAPVSTTSVTFAGGFSATGTTAFTGNSTFSSGTLTLNNGVILPPTAIASITAPPATNLSIYQDSVSLAVSAKNNAGNSYPLYMQVANKVSGAAFNTTETIVAGGATGAPGTPSRNFQLPAGGLVVGSMLRIRVTGFCNSSVANSVTVRIRAGTAGTTADTQVLQFALGSAGTAGTLVSFTLDFLCPITVIGAAATFSNLASSLVVTSGASGLLTGAGTPFLVAQPSAVATFDSTAAKFFEATMVSTAATTTITVVSATAEWI